MTIFWAFSKGWENTDAEFEFGARCQSPLIADFSIPASNRPAVSSMLEYHLAAKIDALSGPLHRVSISPNGRWLALAEAGTVTLVELSKYQVRHRMQCAVEKVNDVIWTPDGRLLCARGAEIAAINISLVSLRPHRCKRALTYGVRRRIAMGK
jgi:hypothetical protein